MFVLLIVVFVLSVGCVHSLGGIIKLMCRNNRSVLRVIMRKRILAKVDNYFLDNAVYNVKKKLTETNTVP